MLLCETVRMAVVKRLVDLMEQVAQRVCVQPRRHPAIAQGLVGGRKDLGDRHAIERRAAIAQVQVAERAARAFGESGRAEVDVELQRQHFAAEIARMRA